LLTKQLRTPALTLSVAVAMALLGGCGKSPESAPPAANVTSTAASQAPGAGPAESATSAPSQADADRAAELAAKEKELADREAVLKQKEIEQELARRAADDAAARQAASQKSVATKPPTPAKTGSVAAAAPAAQPAPPPPPILVPAGTPISVKLASSVSSKTANVGDPVQGRLASDLVVGGRRVAAAGSALQGSVTQVVSGSKKVGGTPTLGITFDSLVVANGSSAAINAQLVQQAASDTGKDTAKIVGGAAAGAIIGHQISHKSGAIVGGVLGGAAGTAVAQNTGGEVSLPAGTVVNVTISNSFQVNGG
jgi:hypothetical protein